MTDVLLGVVIALLVALIVLVVRRKGLGAQDVEVAVSGSWVRLGLAERIGAVEAQARQNRDSYRSFERLLRVPAERGSFGELALETVLSDGLPPDLFSIRQRTFDGRNPDGAIRSTAGIICIDSKFPLDNYRRLLDTTDPTEAEACKRRFLRDLRGHLAKVAEDYIKPDKGSADFAFVYIPSEAVFYYLLHEAHDLLREYSRRGVQVVSPLTLSTKIELIKAGVHAQRLSEGAQQVRDDLRALGERFAALEAEWQTLYRTHLFNLTGKAEEVDRRYQALCAEFRRIASIGEGEG